MRTRPGGIVLCRTSNDAGASLIEVLVAVVLVVTVIAGVAHLLVWGRREVWFSGSRSIAVTLAAEKLERLRALTWELDEGGTPRSDTSTDLSVEPPTASGAGLQPSPAGALTSNTPGYVDYVDGEGRWRGNGVRTPAGAAFVRRWSVEAFGGDGGNTVILTVLVLPLADAHLSWSTRGVRLATVRTRVAR
jgi:hypothetical protein